MELLPLSKFKLQLLALVSEVRHLRETEQSAREDLHRSIQKQKQTELEFGRKIQELQLELASSEESRCKLASKVKYLENDNMLLEKKQKELKETIDNLLQSREAFISHYEESTCEMKHSIEIRDKKLAVLSEKLHAHLLLFSSIEKEAFIVKQVVDDVQRLMSEKEQVVAGLKKKMDKISTFEKEFMEKICFLESNLRNNQNEIRRKDIIVSELKEQLEAAKTDSNLQPQIEELQKALVMKEEAIQHLTAEKQVLRFEAQSLALTLGRIQETIIGASTEDQKAVPSLQEGQEACAVISKEENNRADDMIEADNEVSQHKDLEGGAAETTALPSYQENSSVNNHSPERLIFEPSMSEQFAHSPPQSVCSDHQSTAHILNISEDGKKGSCTSSVHQLDSESSTTNAEASEAAKYDAALGVRLAVQ